MTKLGPKISYFDQSLHKFITKLDKYANINGLKIAANKCSVLHLIKKIPSALDIFSHKKEDAPSNEWNAPSTEMMIE
jgi:hypothetical protein